MKTTTKQRVARMQAITQTAELRRKCIAIEKERLIEQIGRLQVEAKCESWQARYEDMERRFREADTRCRQLVKACHIVNVDTGELDNIEMVHVGTAIERYERLTARDVEHIWADIMRRLGKRWSTEVKARFCKAVAEWVFSPSYHMTERKQAWTREMMENLWKKFPGAHLLAPGDFYAIWDACMDAIKTDEPDKF